MGHNFSKNMTMSLFVFFETLAMAGGLEAVNLICARFNFSLFSFTFYIIYYIYNNYCIHVDFYIYE